MLDNELTATQMVAAATDVLESAGFARIPESTIRSAEGDDIRVFEDDYSIVGLSVFETWADLADNWIRSQEALVKVISRHANRSEPKTWDGYLILLSPARLPSDRTEAAERIRHDTSHVRKMVATAEDIQSLPEMGTVLLPLLPLSEEDVAITEGRPIEDTLPESLEEQYGVDRAAVKSLMEAFQEQRSLMEALHRHLNPK